MHITLTSYLFAYPIDIFCYIMIIKRSWSKKLG